MIIGNSFGGVSRKSRNLSRRASERLGGSEWEGAGRCERYIVVPPNRVENSALRLRVTFPRTRLASILGSMDSVSKDNGVADT